jgi:hypothetical protein
VVSTAPTVPFRFSSDVGGSCSVTDELVGILVVGSTGDLAIQGDDGQVTPLMWAMASGYHPRQSGSSVEVLDKSEKVVAATGHRYSLGGTPAVWAKPYFWVCGLVQTQG